VIESAEYQALLIQNREILARHAERHDMSGSLDIEIGSRYQDWDTAMSAREYLVKKYGKPKSVPFHVSSRKYGDEEATIDLVFDLNSVPDAELITKYEFMLQDAAEKFGGETPGWEIALKST
jgi:Regulator of ribonuclease activity B